MQTPDRIAFICEFFRSKPSPLWTRYGHSGSASGCSLARINSHHLRTGWLVMVGYGWLWLVMDQAPYPLETKVLFHQWPTTSGTLTLFQGRPGRRWSGRYCSPTDFPRNRARDHWISRPTSKNRFKSLAIGFSLSLLLSWKSVRRGKLGAAVVGMTNIYS